MGDSEQPKSHGVPKSDSDVVSSNAGRRGRRLLRPATPEELSKIPPDRRVELYFLERDRPWQRLASIGVLVGLLVTAVSVIYTARTWATAQEQQISDRYTRAVEQIGADKSAEVRVGGLYALGRIAKDSRADASTVMDVVTAYVLGHDKHAVALSSTGPLGVSGRWRPGPDLAAALRVLGGIASDYELYGNLTGVDLSNADWARANLANAYLHGVDLTGADLSGTDLTGSDLTYCRLAGPP
ncbi:pentapeptide repeat-containing protein [Streptosporangiaceae bacterium NEAU-GS5]|nr:pentapeptide repeat-containing protein [Streptosporangiaceae bacterium NEAU-GS5]